MLNLFQHPSRAALCSQFMRQPCVYILASRSMGTLYVGVTSNLMQRVHQHRSGTLPGFTSRYAIYRLIRIEHYDDMPAAIGREKQLKRWHRQWKINLVESENPHWQDLAVDLGFPPIGARNGP